MANTNGLLRVLAGLAVLGLGAATAAAAPRGLVTPAGDLLLVEEVLARPGSASVALRATLQRASGALDVSYVPGTEDEAFDVDPWLFLDPLDRQPTLVWSRHNGSDYDVVIARHDGRGWSAAVPLTWSTADEIRPRAYAAPGEGFHLIWDVPGRPADETRYALFRSDTLVAVRGPEVVPRPDHSALHGGRTSSGTKTDPYDPGGTYLEGGGDSPGLGKNDPGGGGTEPPPTDDSTVSCADGGMCRTGGSSLKEGATTGCDEFSLVVAERGRVCWMTRDAGGWSTRACYAGSDLSLVKRGLDLQSGSACMR